MATTYTPLLELPKHDPTDPFDITKINEGFDLIDAGMAKAYRGKAAHNLLDNSDFSNPVNQRGQTTYSASGYTIDRWKISHASALGTLTINNNSISLVGGAANAYSNFFQIANLSAAMIGKAMTFAVNCAELGIVVLNLIYGTNKQISTSDGTITLIHYDGNNFYIRVSGTTARTFYWAALYEGTYTADTLPEYQPKGYAAELAECQRYYRQSYTGEPSAYGAVSFIAPESGATVPVVNWDTPMRITPTVTVMSWGDIGENAIRDWSRSADVAINGPTYFNRNGFGISFNRESLIAGNIYAFHYTASADL